jgi:predicted nucleotidyltransferase
MGKGTKSKYAAAAGNDGYMAFSTIDASGGSAPKEITLMTECSVPWLQEELEEEFDSDGLAIVKLHNEIIKFCDFCALSRDERRQRKLVLQEVSDIIMEVYPQCKIAVFGSMLTKILTPTSDIDMAFYDLDMTGVPPLEPLYKVAEALSAKGVASYVEVFSNAKVPIIKCDHFPTGINFDICLNNTSGLATGKLIRENAKLYPQLRPLAITLKIFLSQRKLNETYSGGVGSFLLCSMLISFLQQRRRIEAATGAPQAWNLGSLLLDFFRLYGTQLNPYHAGISLLNGGKYFPKRLAGPSWVNAGRLGILAIQNPTEPDTDMGRNSFMFFKVRRAFEHAYQVLYTGLCGDALEAVTRSGTEQFGYLSFVIRPDDPVLVKRLVTIQQNRAETGGGNDEDEDEDEDLLRVVEEEEEELVGVGVGVVDLEADASANIDIGVATPEATPLSKKALKRREKKARKLAEAQSAAGDHAPIGSTGDDEAAAADTGDANESAPVLDTAAAADAALTRAREKKRLKQQLKRERKQQFKLLERVAAGAAGVGPEDSAAGGATGGGAGGAVGGAAGGATGGARGWEDEQDEEERASPVDAGKSGGKSGGKKRKASVLSDPDASGSSYAFMM